MSNKFQKYLNIKLIFGFQFKHFLIAIPFIVFSFLLISPLLDYLFLFLVYGKDQLIDGLHFTDTRLGELSNGYTVSGSERGIRLLILGGGITILSYFYLFLIKVFINIIFSNKDSKK